MYDLDAPALTGVLGSWSAGADPLNEQLAEAIRCAIADGDLAPGTRLPSERDLAHHLGLSRTTIVGAYDRLRSSGLLRSRQGSGTRVTARLPGAPRPWPEGAPGLAQADLLEGLARSRHGRERRRRDAAAPAIADDSAETDVISLTLGALRGWSGIGDVVAEAMREDLPALLRDFGYLPHGVPALREAIARHLGSQGMPTAPEEVLVTSGAQQAIHLLAEALGGPDAVIAIEDPTYVGAVDAFRAAGSRMLSLPVATDGLRLDLLRQTLGSVAAAFVYVVPSYHNPTGAVMPESARRELARLAESTGTLVVEDLTPALVSGARLPPPIGAFVDIEGIVSVGSLSKSGWAGLRVGWIRAEGSLIARIAAAKTVADHGSSLLSQVVALRVLARAADFAEHAERESAVRRAVAAEALTALLPEWRWLAPVGGLSYWVRLPYGDATSFVRVAAEHGVVVRPGPVASPQGGFRDHLRIAVGEDPDRLREGIERLAAAWADYRPVRAGVPAVVSVSV